MKILRRVQFEERVHTGRMSDGSDAAEAVRHMDQIDVLDRSGTVQRVVLPIGASDQEILDATPAPVDMQPTSKADLELLADLQISEWQNRKSFRVEMEARLETPARIDKMKELEDKAYTKARKAVMDWIQA